MGDDQMRTTIACKKHSAGILYIIVTVVGIGILVYAFAEKNFITGIFGALLTVISAVLSIQFLSLPSSIVVLSDDDTLILPKGVVIRLDSINDVSYRRASARGIQYRWGTITIYTHSDTYKYGFVSDCERVAKLIAKLMYDAKAQAYNAEPETFE